MSDFGKNLDINPSFGSSKSSGTNSSKKAEPDTKLESPTDISNSQIVLENKNVYKNPSLSHDSLSLRNQDSKKIENPINQSQKDFELKVSNPVLAAQLQNQKVQKSKSKKQKKTPPEPSIQVQFSTKKGLPINPRKVKPQIPGRLKFIIDDPENLLEKLNKALDQNYILEDNDLVTKKTFSVEDIKLHPSLAEFSNIDEDLMDFSKKDFISILKNLLEEIPPSDEHINALKSIILTLEDQKNSSYLNLFIQFFLPIPFPFVFLDVDEEFFKDEQELLREFNEKDHDPENDEDQEGEDDEDQEEDVNNPDCISSLSIKTKNYNKLHFYIKQNSKTNSFKILVKGDSSASEILIPIETEMEDFLFNDLNTLNFVVSTWKDSVLRITEKPVIKSQFKGKFNPIMMKICNSIVQGILKNDIDLNDENTGLI